MPVNRRLHAIIITLLAISTLFAYYFLLYLPQQEEKLIIQRQRALLKIAENFQEKYKVYEKNSKTKHQKLQEEKDSTNQKNIDKNNLIESEIKDESNKNLFLIRNHKPSTIATDTIIFSVHNGKDSASFGTSINNFFSTLKRDDSFEEYIILKDNTPILNSSKSNVIQLPNIYAQTEEIEKGNFLEKGKKVITNSNIVSIDTLSKIKLPSGLDVKINSQSYKLFTTAFQINLSNANKAKLFIYGFDSERRFTSESKVFPTLIIVFICTGLLFIIFALPALKLFFMNGLERLHIKDIVLTSSSFIFCTGILIIIALTLLTYNQDKDQVDSRLKELTINIEDSLYCELNTINKLIRQIENDPNAFSRLSTRMSAFNSNLKKYLNLYPHLTAAFWVNSRGDIDHMISSSTIKDTQVEKLNLSERNYFKRLKDNEGWISQLFDKDTFYIESISSWTSGSKTAIISKPSLARTLAGKVSKDSIKVIGNKNDIEVIAVEAKLSSVIDPILPLGFHFSIIDNSGKVLFHSDKRKNLEENFLEECGRDKQVIALLNSQSASFLDLNYYNRDHRVYMKSFKNLPWHIVVSYDKTLIQAPFLYISSFTIIGVIIVGLISVLLSTIVALVYQRKSKLKRKIFPYKWLWPYKKNTSSFIKITACNIAILFCLCLFNWYHFYHSSSNMIMILAINVYALILSYSISFGLLAKPKMIDSIEKLFKYDRYQYILFCFSVLTILVTIAFVSLTDFLWLYLICGSVILLIWITPLIKVPAYQEVTQTANLHQNIVSETKAFLKKKNNAFISMIFTYLILVSISPAFFLFRSIHDQEKILQTKFELYHIVSAIEDRRVDLRKRHSHTWLLEKNKKSTEALKLDSAYESFHAQGLYYENMSHEICNYESVKSQEFKTIPFDHYVYKIRPSLHETFEKNSGFIFNKSSSESWNSTLYDSQEVVLTYYPTKYPNVNDSVRLGAQIPKLFPDSFSVPTSIKGIILSFLLILFLFALWKIISYIIVKMFGLNLYAYPDIIKEDDRYLLEIDRKKSNKRDLIHDRNELNIFVISTPFSHTKDILKDKAYKTFSLSQTLDEEHYHKKFLSKVRKTKNEIVVIEDFGYGIDTVNVGTRALEVIKILQSNHNKIVIISKLTPKQVIEKYEKLKVREFYKDQDLDLFISKWKDLLAEFVEMYFSYVVSITANRKRLLSDADCDDLLEYELGVHKPYFSQLHGSICKVVEEKCDGKEKKIKFELNDTLAEIEQKLKKEGKKKELETFKEELLLKIQTLASPFYYALWNACSKDEKFFLYDLSTDDFANTKNTDVIIKLLEKGLIYCDESLHIINESFRNFILNIDKTEALEMERELQRNGTWKVYSSVIVLVIIGLIAFFIFANESIIEQFSALIAGLAAVLPYVLRLGGLYQPSVDDSIRS